MNADDAIPEHAPYEAASAVEPAAMTDRSSSLAERRAVRMSTVELRRPLDGSVIHLLHRACQVADVLFTKETDTSGLTPRQYAVLLAISHNKDISQTGLVQVTGIDRSTLAEIIKRLLKRDLIKRRRTRLDARAYAVRLTETGMQLLAQMEPAAGRADRRLLTAIDAKSQEALTGSLAMLLSAFETAEK